MTNTKILNFKRVYRLMSLTEINKSYMWGGVLLLMFLFFTLFPNISIYIFGGGLYCVSAFFIFRLQKFMIRYKSGYLSIPAKNSEKVVAVWSLLLFYLLVYICLFYVAFYCAETVLHIFSKQNIIELNILHIPIDGASTSAMEKMKLYYASLLLILTLSVTLSFYTKAERYIFTLFILLYIFFLRPDTFSILIATYGISYSALIVLALFLSFVLIVSSFFIFKNKQIR